MNALLPKAIPFQPTMGAGFGGFSQPIRRRMGVGWLDLINTAVKTYGDIQVADAEADTAEAEADAAAASAAAAAAAAAAVQAGRAPDPSEVIPGVPNTVLFIGAAGILGLGIYLFATK